MGKGQIVSGGTNGQYQVKMIYAYRARVEQKILSMQQNITSYEGQRTTLDAQIAAETDVKKKEALVLKRSIINLQITSLQKQIAYYQNNMPADPTVAAWCMDLTEDLSGYVGTAEIPGEATTVLIRPGYNGGATYGATRDGQLMPSIAGEPNQVLFNWMLLPGWQRHKPIYRIGTIVPDSINFSANTCSVCLDAAYSSQQSLPAIDGAVVSDCNMGDDSQSEYLTNAGEDFCSRNPGHPFCVQGEGSEVNLTDAMLAQLREANYYVNWNYGRANDKSGVTVGDRWDVMSPGGSGDCEDFALTKMQRLVDNYGWNPDNLKLVTAYSKNGEYHAMLGVRTTNRGLVVLDVNYDEVMESGRVPYRLDKIALASDTWKNYTRRMDAVPIEYMQCNAYAFADGDRVIVQFSNQDWTQPKVIGFLENPEACGCDSWVIGSNGFGVNDFSLFRWTFDNDTWTESGEIPGHEYYGSWIIRDNIFATGRGLSFNLFGGFDTSTLTNNNTYSRNDYSSGVGWQVKQDIPEARGSGQGFIVGGKSYVVSGGRWLWDWGPPFWAKIAPNDNNYEYDAVADSWANKASHPSARAWSRAFVINSVAYCFGGSTTYPSLVLGTAANPPDSVYAFNQSGNTWISKQDMLRGRWRMGVGMLSGYGYVFQGRVMQRESGDFAFSEPSTYGYFTKKIDRYNSSGDLWESAGEIDVDPGPYASNGISECGNSGFGLLCQYGIYDAAEESFTLKATLNGRDSQQDQLTVIGA